MTNLTKNEITILKTCLNYDNREDQLSDNMSNGYVESFMNVLNMNAQQVGGIMSSLQQKGLCWPSEESDLEPVFWITEKGVNAVFDIIEKENTGL